SEQASSAASQITGMFSNIGASLMPFGANIGKQFNQMQQLAKERMGTASDITELPAEYRELEDKVDKIKLLHDGLLKVARNYTLHHYDYEAPIASTFADLASTVQNQATSVAAAGAKVVGRAPAFAAASPREPATPTGLSAAFAVISQRGANDLGTEEPLGAALAKFAATHERIARLRLDQDAAAAAKFVAPVQEALNTTLAVAMRARRNVTNVRLTYDASRTKLKAAAPERVEAARVEMEAAEDEFVAAVDEAMGKMKVVVESPDLLKCLADLTAAQLQYFKSGYEALAELSPEMDELQVTNEAL
ncbi:hypothetical protein CXG81DRAFT_6773, partial [Caulochytrium protostelioides]